MTATKANYKVIRDAEDGYFYVVDGGDYLECCDTEAEAREEMARYEAAEAAEAKADHLSDLQDEVQTLAANCDDAELLTRIKALLSK